MNTSPNVWSLGDTATVQDGRERREVKVVGVEMKGIPSGLVLVEMDDGRRRLRPYAALRRIPHEWVATTAVATPRGHSTVDGLGFEA